MNKALVSFDFSGAMEIGGDVDIWDLEKLTMDSLLGSMPAEEIKQLVIKHARYIRVDTYDKIGVIKRVIDEFDPMGFSPRNDEDLLDEYMPEVIELASRVDYDSTVEEIANQIRIVIEFYFSKTNIDMKYYKIAARKLASYFKMLKKNEAELM